MTPEGAIKKKFKKQIEPLINAGKVWHFMPVQSRYGAQALDFLLCAGSTFIAVEAKRPGKKMTALQERTADLIVSAGGKVLVVDDDESIAHAISIIARAARYLA